MSFYKKKYIHVFQFILLLFLAQQPKGSEGLLTIVIILLPFSQFNLCLQNHWASLNQTWKECTLDGPLKSLWSYFNGKSTEEMKGPNVPKNSVF